MSRSGSRPNVFDDNFEYDPADPAGYRSGGFRIGDAAGGAELVVRLYQIPAGESLCPYHYEYVEEWLIVLHGELQLRAPDGISTVGEGDVVCFAAGPAGAHKLTNLGGAGARVLMFSSAHEPAVSVYPDSGKVGVWAGPDDRDLLFPRDAVVDYYEGENAGASPGATK
jgi:uncharacterized cupin superfamily protein